MNRLQGRVALVTGAQQGIGRAVALRFALEGAAVAVNYLNNQPAAEAVARELDAGGGHCTLVQGDVSVAADVLRMVSATEAEFGTVDLLVNNAGVFPRVPLLEMTESEWDFVQSVNLKGTFLCTQAVARRPVEAGRPGAIISIASVAAYRTSPRGARQPQNPQRARS
ncbi:MAG: SDR family NAD(P)-dependent oxidoreductase [Dehalococcoidia bacterium]